MVFTSKLRILILVLLSSLFTSILIFSQETQTIQHLKTKEELKLYPKTYDHFPELPSPYTLKEGTEIVVAFTKDEKYALITVTVENGHPLLYSRKIQDLYGKDRQLDADSGDFPVLAKTGLHSESELCYF